MNSIRGPAKAQRSGFCGERRGNEAGGYSAKGRMKQSGVCPDAMEGKELPGVACLLDK